MKEDYSYEKIFTFAFFILLGLLVGFISSKIFLFTSYWFYFEMLGVSIGFLIGLMKLKLSFFESFEAIVFGFLPWMTFIFLFDSIKNSSIFSFLAFWVSLILFFLFFLTDSYYKSFSWYKSGRVGFSGLFIASLFFLIRSIVSLFFPNVISLSGPFEVYISGTFAFIFFLLLLRLSKSQK